MLHCNTSPVWAKGGQSHPNNTVFAVYFCNAVLDCITQLGPATHGWHFMVPNSFGQRGGSGCGDTSRQYVPPPKTTCSNALVRLSGGRSLFSIMRRMSATRIAFDE